MSERYSRQSFLGEQSEKIISKSKIAIIGLGGGGSHIVQQAAHIGFTRYVLFDPQDLDESNLNRVVGAKERDTKMHTPKIKIAQRVIRGLHPRAKIEAYKTKWQEKSEALKSCAMIFGCTDSFSERRQLEEVTRRYLIPYIDIGMDVHPEINGEPPRMGGQIILSMSGGPCMWCINFLSEEKLARETEQYGAAGPRPQVIWANGVLASRAVGVAMDLLTDWNRSLRKMPLLSYDGNRNVIEDDRRLGYLPKECMHYPNIEIGDPVFHTL